MEFTVMLNMVKDARKFVLEAQRIKCDVIVKSLDRHYMIDGKSLMGVLSLDLSKPLTVHIEDEKECTKLLKIMKKVVVG